MHFPWLILSVIGCASFCHGDGNGEQEFLHHGKEFGLDFSEPAGSRSRSNGQNESAIDDIARLNNITVAMFKEPDAKFDFLLKKGTSKRLLLAHEGDMIMDGMDQITLHTFVKTWGEENDEKFKTDREQDSDFADITQQTGNKKPDTSESPGTLEDDAGSVIDESSDPSESDNNSDKAGPSEGSEGDSNNIENSTSNENLNPGVGSEGAASEPSDGILDSSENVENTNSKEKFRGTSKPTRSTPNGGRSSTRPSGRSTTKAVSTNNPSSNIQNLQNANQAKPTPSVVMLTKPTQSNAMGSQPHMDPNQGTNMSTQQINGMQYQPVKKKRFTKKIGKLLTRQVDNSNSSNSKAKAMANNSDGNLDGNLDEDEKKFGEVKRTVTPFGRKMWVTNVIPFIITHEGSQRWPPGHLYMKIRKVMDYFEGGTCIKFRERKTSDKQYVKIFRGTGCYAEIGRQFWKDGPTLMSLGEWCIQDHIIMHLLMHVLGFLHETTRPDRDSFVVYHKDKAADKYRNYFRRHFQYDYSLQNTEYDFRSIMHYGNKAFTARNNITVESELDKNEPLGGKVMTKYDISKIHKMYHCDENNGSIPVKAGFSSWAAWSVPCLNISNKGCNKIRQRACIGEDVSLCPGVDEYGVEDELDKCDEKECASEYLVPHWSQWEPPGPCSKTCDRGIEVSKRKCNNPPPTRNERCAGSSKRTSICRVKKCNPDPFDTDFENHWGVWTQNFQFTSVWIRKRGRSLFERTGPWSDHTTGKGFYALLTTSDPVKDINKIGELISDPIRTPDGHKCIVFYFLMNGIGVNYLRFYLRVNNVYFQIWHRQGHQGNANGWLKGAISLPKSKVEYYLILDGKTGMFGDSDIAVDDFTITDGFCPKGVEGCHDFFYECEEWRKQGLCVTQFKYLIFSCCKSCEHLNYEGLDLDLEW